MNRALLRLYVSRSSDAVNTKLIKLKFPVSNILKPARSSNILDGNSSEETSQILQQFIVEKPNLDANFKGVNKKRYKKEIDEAAKQKIRDLAENFLLSSFERLPLVKPKSVPGSPYNFYTHKNSDTSILRSPRISVTKLLTKLWCELREYYDIFAGSKGRKSTVEIEKGKKHHEMLELEVHPVVDTSELRQVLLLRVQVVLSKMELEEENALSAEPEVYELLKASNAKVLQLIEGSNDVNLLAGTWLHDIVEKLYSLVTKSYAREVLVHSYIDLESALMVTDGQKLKEEDVLVSGIIDYLELVPTRTNSSKYALYSDVDNWIQFETKKQINGQPMVDLSTFLEEVKKYVNVEYRNEYTLKVTDVKTRSRRQIPPQSSVVNAAKQQVSSYKNYLEIMSNGSGYKMLLENAKRRHCDVDEPIGLGTVIEMLRTSSSYLYEDFQKLANGERIGFKEYDDFVEEKYLQDKKGPEVAYDLSLLLDRPSLLNRSPFGGSSESETNFDYAELIEPLLKEWKIPLTLRYFAARSGQFYSLLQPFLVSPLTSVDYHYGGESFREVKFELADAVYTQSLKDSIGFWNGTREPQPVDDLSKCNYCDYKEVCTIPNPHLSFSLSREIGKLTS